MLPKLLMFVKLVVEVTRIENGLNCISRFSFSAPSIKTKDMVCYFTFGLNMRPFIHTVQHFCVVEVFLEIKNSWSFLNWYKKKINVYQAYSCVERNLVSFIKRSDSFNMIKTYLQIETISLNSFNQLPHPNDI